MPFFFHGTVRFACAFIWKSKAPLKIKVFAWLAILKRIWTADRLQRHGLQHPVACVMCDQEQKSVDHLLISCVAAKDIWFAILSLSNHGSLASTSSLQVLEWWSHIRNNFQKKDKRGLDTLVLLVMWMIWKECNARIFNNKSSPLSLPFRFGSFQVKNGMQTRLWEDIWLGDSPLKR